MQNLYGIKSFNRVFAQIFIQFHCLHHMLKSTNLLDGPKVTNHSQFSVFGDKLFGLVNQNYCELINIVLYTKLYMLAISMKVCKSF